MFLYSLCEVYKYCWWVGIAEGRITLPRSGHADTFGGDRADKQIVQPSGNVHPFQGLLDLSIPTRCATPERLDV